MRRCTLVTLMLLLSVSWLDDFCGSFQTPDPTDDNCTESDVGLPVYTWRHAVNDYVFGYGPLRGSSIVRSSFKIDSNPSAPLFSELSETSLASRHMPLRC